MALLDSKQLNPKLTGSFILSGSTQTFIGASDFQGSITASGNISGSLTSTGSFGRVETAGDINASGNVRGSRFEIDGATEYIDTSLGNLFIVTTGDIAAQPGTGKALKVTGGLSATSHITASGDVYVSGNISGSSTSTGSFGRVSTSTLDLDSIQGNWTNAGNTVADGGTVTTIDINGGTVDGATVGASSHTTIKGTTIDATTDFTIDGLVITADTITNDAGLSIVASSGDITLDPAGNNVLPGGDSADDLGVSGTAWKALYVDSIEMNGQGSIAGVTHVTASGAISASGDILSDGRIYEAGSSVIDHATAMAIVFGG